MCARAFRIAFGIAAGIAGEITAGITIESPLNRFWIQAIFIAVLLFDCLRIANRFGALLWIDFGVCVFLLRLTFIFQKPSLVTASSDFDLDEKRVHNQKYRWRKQLNKLAHCVTPNEIYLNENFVNIELFLFYQATIHPNTIAPVPSTDPNRTTFIDYDS